MSKLHPVLLPMVLDKSASVNLCVKCGVAFTPHRKNAIQKFCSMKCCCPRVPEKKCPKCKTTFQPKLNRTIYCSPWCAHNRHR